MLLRVCRLWNSMALLPEFWTRIPIFGTPERTEAYLTRSQPRSIGLIDLEVPADTSEHVDVRLEEKLKDHQYRIQFIRFHKRGLRPLASMQWILHSCDLSNLARLEFNTDVTFNYMRPDLPPEIHNVWRWSKSLNTVLLHGFTFPKFETWTGFLTQLSHISFVGDAFLTRRGISAMLSACAHTKAIRLDLEARIDTLTEGVIDDLDWVAPSHICLPELKWFTIQLQDTELQHWILSRIQLPPTCSVQIARNDIICVKPDNFPTLDLSPPSSFFLERLENAAKIDLELSSNDVDRYNPVFTLVFTAHSPGKVLTRLRYRIRTTLICHLLSHIGETDPFSRFTSLTIELPHFQLEQPLQLPAEPVKTWIDTLRSLPLITTLELHFSIGDNGLRSIIPVLGIGDLAWKEPVLLPNLRHLSLFDSLKRDVRDIEIALKIRKSTHAAPLETLTLSFLNDVIPSCQLHGLEGLVRELRIVETERGELDDFAAAAPADLQPDTWRTIGLNPA